jgi:serine/threonine-protein kinase
MIAQYRIVRKLGAGGMGAVYLADDTHLERRVALKVLLDVRHATDVSRTALREARAAAALDHPNICAIYEAGSAGGVPFIAMQYVDGELLSARLKWVLVW